MEDLKTIQGKNEVESIQPGFLWELGLVLSHGNTKYAKDNWQGMVDPTAYHGAILRHLLRYMAGEENDPETGLHHMAHLAASTMFLYWFDKGEEIDPQRRCHCHACTEGK